MEAKPTTPEFINCRFGGNKCSLIGCVKHPEHPTCVSEAKRLALYIVTGDAILENENLDEATYVRISRNNSDAVDASLDKLSAKREPFWEEIKTRAAEYKNRNVGNK